MTDAIKKIVPIVENPADMLKAVKQASAQNPNKPIVLYLTGWTNLPDGRIILCSHCVDFEAANKSVFETLQNSFQFMQLPINFASAPAYEEFAKSFGGTTYFDTDRNLIIKTDAMEFGAGTPALLQLEVKEGKVQIKNVWNHDTPFAEWLQSIENEAKARQAGKAAAPKATTVTPGTGEPQAPTAPATKKTAMLDGSVYL